MRATVAAAHLLHCSETRNYKAKNSQDRHARCANTLASPAQRKVGLRNMCVSATGTRTSHRK